MNKNYKWIVGCMGHKVGDKSVMDPEAVKTIRWVAAGVIELDKVESKSVKAAKE